MDQHTAPQIRARPKHASLLGPATYEPPAQILPRTRPLLDPQSASPLVEDLRRLGYVLSAQEIKKITTTRTEIHAVDKARDSVLDYMRRHVPGGMTIAAKMPRPTADGNAEKHPASFEHEPEMSLEQAMHTTENYFTRTSAKITKQALGIFFGHLGNFGTRDWQGILRHTPDYPEFTVFRKTLQLLISKYPQKKNAYAHTRQMFGWQNKPLRKMRNGKRKAGRAAHRKMA